jgi:AcrR family transcriptional regulator
MPSRSIVKGKNRVKPAEHAGTSPPAGKAAKGGRSLGLRERNKLDKLVRIRESARALFEKKGYDATSVREIADRANVAPATVFLYAKEKRDLLYLIFRDELPEVLELSARNVRGDAAFLDQLMDYFTPILRFWRPYAHLARVMLREQFNLGGEEATAAASVRARINSDLRRLIEQAQQRGEVRSDLEVDLLVQTLWANFRFYNDDWMRDPQPKLQTGLENLRTGLSLLLSGTRVHRGQRKPPRRQSA